MRQPPPRPPAYFLLVATVAAALLSITFASPQPANAYQRTRTCGTDTTRPCEAGERSKPLWWPVRCLRYRVNERGTDQFERTAEGEIGDRLRELVRRGFETWNEPNCSNLSLESGGPTEVSDVRYRRSAGWSGNQNVVVWRDDGWPHTSTSTIALTSVTYEFDDGRIVDADMEFNTSFYEFAHLESAHGQDKIDFLNTLTHEVGHFVGLDHPRNQPEATMHASAQSGEIKKRTLEDDDRNGLCAAYPSEGGAAACSRECRFRPCQPCDSDGTELPAFCTRRPDDERGCGGCTTTRGDEPDGPPGPIISVLVWVGLRSWSRLG